MSTPAYSEMVLTSELGVKLLEDKNGAFLAERNKFLLSQIEAGRAKLRTPLSAEDFAIVTSVV